MKEFFFIAGVVVTIIGLVAIAIISGVYIAVRYFGLTLTLGTIKDGKNEQ